MSLRYLLLLIVTVLFSACSAETDQDETLSDYPNGQLLIEATELNSLLDDQEIFLIDTREELGDSLIPGAVHFASVQNLTDQDHPIANYLIGPEEFERVMQEIGLNNEDRVVLYDEGNALAAARLFYALDYYGFSNASILNGGIQAWKEQGGELVASAAEPEEGTFEVAVNETLMCDFEYVAAAAQSDDKVIFDARSLEEYTGEDERAAQS